MQFNIRYMFWVSSIASRLMFLSTRTSVQIYKAIVISSGDTCLILAHLNDIDMTPIGPRWIYPLDEPAKFDSVIHPHGRSGRRRAARNLDKTLRVEK